MIKFIKQYNRRKGDKERNFSGGTIKKYILRNPISYHLQILQILQNKPCYSPDIDNHRPFSMERLQKVI